MYAPHIDFLRNSAGNKVINDKDINEIIAHNV
jgi:hypothetical protein